MQKFRFGRHRLEGALRTVVLGLVASILAACGGQGDTPSSSSSLSSSSSPANSSSSSGRTVVTIEENERGFCQIGNGVIDTVHSGYRGAGFVDSVNEVGAEVTWQLYTDDSQDVTLEFRYANGDSASRPAVVSVNGQELASAEFSPTAAWANWNTQTVEVHLANGSNTIALISTNDNGLANIDSMSVIGADVSADSCPPAAVAVATDKWFAVVNRASGLALDIDSAITDPGALLTQWQRTDAENQSFRFVASEDNYYRMVARHSGLAMDIYEFDTNDGAQIVQWEDLNGDNQQFQLLDLQGYFQIVSALSHKALAPLDYSTDGAAPISQYTPDVDNEAQHWQLVEVGDYNPSTGGGTPGECGAGSPKAVVTGAPGNYQMNGTSYGGNYREAIFAALGELTPGRTEQERVSIMADGDVGDARINLSSNTIFEVCGTMNVAPASRGSITIWGSTTQNISIPYLTMTGTPSFAMLIADTTNLHLGQINLLLNGGSGIRFDNRGVTRNVRIDDVYVEGTSGHGVETWNIDGLEIGSVTARSTGYAGLLLNNTRNADIGTVDGNNTGRGTGYATLRFANTNGRINGGWPTNIRVDKVISRGGGRGIFCVSNSGGVEINSVDLANNGNNSMLIENCHNFTINEGTVDGGGEVRIAARSEFPNTSDVTISNLQVTNTSVRESPCGDNISWRNLSVTGGNRNTCN